jgi:hypothetical protein
MSIAARRALVRSPNTIFQSDSQRQDLLDPSKTNTNLIALLGNLIAKGHIIGFTAIHSDHHDDSELAPGPLHIGTHQGGAQGGYAADCWPMASTTPGDWLDAEDPRFVEFCHDVGIDPFELQRGLAGSALTHDAIVAAGRGFFQDDGGDHIHIGAIG